MGGLDIEASLDVGLGRSRVIAQVKQYDRPVPRAFVDELRGAMVRHGAQQGLLFTSATFSHAARDAAAMGAYAMPIRLVDGGELSRLLKAKEVPIRADAARPEPDRPYLPAGEGAGSEGALTTKETPPEHGQQSGAEGPSARMTVMLSLEFPQNPISTSA